jgi:hypothetical protein
LAQNKWIISAAAAAPVIAAEQILFEEVWP